MEFAVHMKNNKTGEERIKKLLLIMWIMLHAKIFIMEVIGAGQDRNRGTMFLIIWNTLEEDTIKTNKSCISLLLDKIEHVFYNF